MKTSLTTLVFSLLCYCSIAQAPFKFGLVSLADLKMTRYEKDTSATAVVLADYGESSISYVQSSGGWILKFERTKRIKILTQDGANHANFAVLLHRDGGNREKILGLKVITHNLENGRHVETSMNKDAVFEEEYTEDIDITKFTAPNVRAGSVIEVTYKIDSDFVQYLRGWEFQSTIPTIWSEYQVNVPEYFNYNQYMQGHIMVDLNERKVNPKVITITSKIRTGFTNIITRFSSNQVRYNENALRWASENVPAFKTEPFITTEADYISKLNFELASVQFPQQTAQPIVGTWADLNHSFLVSDYFGLAIRNAGFLKRITEDVTSTAKTPQDKAAAIINYIKTNMEWDGRYRKLIDHGLKKSFDEKRGSTAEINLLLVAMLQRAGFEANPVLISTRHHGFVREEIALSSQFNSVICQVIIYDKPMLIDATDRMLPMTLLPEHCLNGKGYVISEKTPGWVPLQAPKSKVFASTELSFINSSEIKGEINISSDGYEGYSLRRTYFEKGEVDYVKDLSRDNGWDIEKSSFENMYNVTAPAKERYTFTQSVNDGNGSIIYLTPFVHLRLAENPFKLEERAYPVDFGKATEHILVCSINIPENFYLEDTPAPGVIMLPNNSGRFAYSVQTFGNTLNVTSVLTINQSLFTQLEYQGLREFYTLVVAKHAEQIVLRKK